LQTEVEIINSLHKCALQNEKLDFQFFLIHLFFYIKLVKRKEKE